MPQQDLPESLLAHALATISEGSLIADAGQNTIYANAAFMTITGYSQQEMAGQNCRLLQGPGTDPKTLDRLRRTLADGGVFRGHLLNYRKNGTVFWNDLTISPLRDAAGLITHFVSVQRDIATQVALQTSCAFRPSTIPLPGYPTASRSKNTCQWPRDGGAWAPRRRTMPAASWTTTLTRRRITVYERVQQQRAGQRLLVPTGRCADRPRRA
jgi:PAS domain S-box-containing protein